MQRLILIDGHAIMHRAFHALPEMTTASGQPINAVYGFISILFRVMAELSPTHLAVVFDRPTPTFRNKLYKDYQIQRPKTDNALISQFGVMHTVLESMQIPFYEKDGYEADDVIGTIAHNVSSDHIDDVVIVTGDRDLLQLVNDHVKLYMPVKGLSEAKLYGEKETIERMGVPPEQIVDLKALMGDPSDNYPGVAGIGPKTAIHLLEQFGSVEKIYKNLDAIKNKAVVEKLVKDKENADISYKLATVVCDAPVSFNVEKAHVHDLATEAAIKLFGELEFKTLLKRLLKTSSKQIVESPKAKPKPEKTTNKEQLGLF